MKKLNLTFILFFFSPLFWRGAGGEVFGQNPLVKQWDKRFGGTDNDYLWSFQQTIDGGYILGGYSTSYSGGDKTEDNWSPYEDYWIIKLDSFGNKQWDKRFGGTASDALHSLQQTTDGGYILGGQSTSWIGGDKTQNSWGSRDYWVVKIDSLGNKQWDKDFGGTEEDKPYSLQQTADGGYILGGYSYSGISGDKTEPNWDTTLFSADYWIVKIDALGNKQWDKRFGGINGDYLFSLQQAIDGGYILGGFSFSGITGDKTQTEWGGSDYWIVKTDSLGNKQWDKDFGGFDFDDLYYLQLTDDGGYILGGISRSDIGGDKTQSNRDTICNPVCTKDYWIIKIDSLGNMQWDKDFGGIDGEDEIGNIFQTPDRGYLIAGTSYSNISGDKTENNLGNEQSWIIKTDSLGIKQWDKTLHTTTYIDDEIGFAIQTKDGCYAMANYTYAGIGGDKSQPNWDPLNFHYDYWIIKFCDTTSTTNLTPTLSKGEGVAIAPNPFTNEITITIQKQNIKQASFTIKNILGQTVLRQERKAPLSFGEGQGVRFDLGFLSKGIYLLEATIDGERMVKKIVKE